MEFNNPGMFVPPNIISERTSYSSLVDLETWFNTLNLDYFTVLPGSNITSVVLLIINII